MARAFAGGAATDKIQTALVTQSNQRTYSIWTYRTGAGGGSLGRIIHKGTSGSTMNFNNGEATSTYDYSQSFSGGSGTWTIPRPGANGWHHLVIVHDSGSAANDPLIYLNAVSQTVTETAAPSGTRTDTAEPYNVGNRGNDNTRAWQGYLAEFAVWDRLLSAGEVLALFNGNRAIQSPVSLVSYIPLVGARVVDFISGTPTLTGTTEAPDPPIYRIPPFNELRPRPFAPGIAR